jgi:hypothetical protein
MVQLFIYHLYDLSQFIVADFNGNDKLELMDSLHKKKTIKKHKRPTLQSLLLL